MISALDYKALKRLMVQGRATWAELAADMGLSAPAAAERVRKLEQQMIITGYAALVDPAAVGYPLTAFISVTLDRPKHRAPFLLAISKMTEVVECFHIAGDGDYLLKVRCRGHGRSRPIADFRNQGRPGHRADAHDDRAVHAEGDSVVTPITVRKDG